MTLDGRAVAHKSRVRASLVAAPLLLAISNRGGSQAASYGSCGRPGSRRTHQVVDGPDGPGLEATFRCPVSRSGCVDTPTGVWR